MSTDNQPLPEKWVKALTKVENMLDETLVAACCRLAILDQATEDGEQAQRRNQDIADLRDRIRNLDRLLQSAEVATTTADLVLAGGEKLARDYLTQADDLRQKLANWSGLA